MSDLQPPLLERYVEAILRGARSEAIDLLAREGARLTPAERIALIAEAQREVGQLWEENRVTIAEEHLATAISHLALARSFGDSPMARPNGKRVIVACVEGEQHELPARMAADTLELAGFEVLFLGANVQTDSLMRIVETRNPDLLALSIAMTFHTPALKNALQRLRTQFPSLPIAVGGHALSFNRTAALQAGASVTGTSAPELLEAARRLTGVAA